MNPQSTARASLLFYLLDPALRSLVLGALAAIALFVFRVKKPSVRLAVWSGVLYAALAMPLLAAALPSLSIPLPAALSSLLVHKTTVSSQPQRLAAAPVSASSANDNRLSAPTLRTTRTRTDRSGVLSPATAREVIRGSRQSEILPTAAISAPNIVEYSAAPRAASASVMARRPFPWIALATTLSGIASALLLARIAIGIVFSKRLARSADTICDREAICVLIRQAHAAGVASAPRLAESDLISVPVTLGALRPVILLPSYWRNWDQRTLNAVIAHEIAHVARRDGLTQRLALIHRALFWFSPLAWMLCRSLANAAEEASDEAALAVVADRAFYAETVIEFFAALAESPRRVYWQGVSMAAPGQAERRVDRILNWKGAVSMRIGKSLAIGLALIGVPVVLLTAAARPSTTQSPAPMILTTPAAPALPSLPALPSAAPAPPAAIAALPQAAPTTPLPPPALAQDSVPPQAPPAPDAPVVAPVAPDAPPPPPRMILVGPDGSINAEALHMEAQDPGNNISIDVSNSIELQELADAAKRMKFQVKGTPQFSAEQQQKLSEMTAQLRVREKQLQDLSETAAIKGPDVKALRQEIASLQDQISAQMKQVNPVASFQFQLAPMGKISIGDFGDRFVIVSNDSPIIMSGNSQDVERATSLRNKINGDFIWLQRDEKSYVIRDQAVVSQAKGYFKPEQDLGAKQEALGKQQQALGDQQRALGDKMHDVHVTVPDLSADMEKIEAQMKQLSASGGTQQQVGDLQRQLGDLMRKMNGTESQAGEQQRQVGEQMRQLGDQQRALGDQQRDLGGQQRDASMQARNQMKQLLDDAIAKGTAQPE
jgi:beta-lactamase regulating signal transducer with metallopeptidase domain